MLRAGAVLLLLAGCEVPPPPPPLDAPHRLSETDAVVAVSPIGYPEGSACGIVNSSSWRGLIRDRADGGRDLVLLGSVGTKPSAAVSVVFDPLVRESHLVQRRANLRAVHPPEPTIDLLEQRRVAATLTYRGELGRLSLLCGNRQIAEFSDPREGR